MLHCVLSVVFLICLSFPTLVKAEQSVPDNIYSAFDYIFSLFDETVDFDPVKVSELSAFVHSTPEETSKVLKERKGAEGAFYRFNINAPMGHLVNYAYNPDVPAYVTMPSSVQKNDWLQPQSDKELRKVIDAMISGSGAALMRGSEREAITPDTNTGGYYSYSQDRIVAAFKGSTGPVLISATIQKDSSDVGKKGCIVGDDKDWNYLFSDETGLNKFGLGWVDSYMYSAHSIIVYVADVEKNVVNAASFKWLNAGWSGINMVNSGHILKGIKRFAADFKTILESQGLPAAQAIAEKQQELVQLHKEQLEEKISSYLKSFSDSDSLDECPGPISRTVVSGEYVKNMSQDEMIRVLLLQYVKGKIGKEAQPSLADTENSQPIQVIN